MNAKKAKHLRKLAGDQKATRQYYGEEHTVRNKTITNLAGEVTHRYQTATYKLNPCNRKLYKQLKTAYKNKAGIWGRMIKQQCIPST